MTLKNFYSSSKFIFAVSTESEKFTRFNVLDGFRGTLVLSVVLQHLVGTFQLPGEYQIFNAMGGNYGVPSFFVLSAFLLTYKQFELMNKSNGTAREILSIIIKYLIRRFFRIYIPFFVYVTFVKMNLSYATRFGNKFQPWYDLVTLKSAGWNHLWTVIPEIRYYGFIPIFTFITYKFQRFFIIWISIIVLLMLATQKFNLFGLKCAYLDHVNRESLFNSFQIFLTGSLLGVIFYKLQNSNYNASFLTIFRFLLGYISLIMFIYGLKQCSGFFMGGKFYCSLVYAIYWSLFIFIILNHDRSLVLDFLNFSFFKKCGLYSFGIYLLHMESFAAVSYLRNNKFVSQSALEIVILDIFICYIYGIVFYYVIENPAMNIGNYLIKKINNAQK
jgi:peptidoglycan/LPS O-acetylase OafA/YrhL